MTAPRDPPPSDIPEAAVAEAARPMSGPVDLPVALLVAARRGDPGAFARFVEQGDVHVRPFVHLTLAGEGSADRVLAAAYVRAYRALPRYRAGQSPALWLHRVAYLATVDELRRLGRDSKRRQPRTRPAPEVPVPDDGPAEPVTLDVAMGALRLLTPDQRALAAMVDLEGFVPAAVARAFGTAPEVIGARLASARRLLTATATEAGRGAAGGGAPIDHRSDPEGVIGGTEAADGPQPPGSDAEDLYAVPTWARDAPVPEPAATAVPEDRSPTAADAAVAAGASDPSDAHEAHLAHQAGRFLAGLVVPTAGATFWVDLGRRLLAERDRPAATTPDPAARLARAHPAELGFSPGHASGAVSTMADRAHHNRPPRSWRRSLATAAAGVVVVSVVAGAVVLGVSGRRPDGSVTGVELADTLARALSASPYLTVDATVDLPAADGATTSQPYRLTLGDEGSWAAERTDAFDRATFDGSAGLFRRLVAVPDPTGGRPDVLASEAAELSAGAPDVAVAPPDPLADLQAVGTLLRGDGDRRATAAGDGDDQTWTYRRIVASGPDGADEEWRVTIDRPDAMPVHIERRRGEVLVRRVRFANWEPSSEIPDGTFRQVLPEVPDLSPYTKSTVTDHGFVTADQAAVAILGRGRSVTPAWLPDGFELAAVALRGEAPVGMPSTAGGTNPPDVSVMSLGYQRGPERITVTTRATTAPATDWTDPFAGGLAPPRTAVRRRTLGDGRYNQVPVQVGTDAVGRAQLWGIDDDTVFTVAGDLTAADAYRVAASLR